MNNIILKNGNEKFKFDRLDFYKKSKFVKEEYRDETIILIKSEWGYDDIEFKKYNVFSEKINRQGENYNVDEVFIGEFELVRKYKTYNSKDTDYCYVISNNYSDKTDSRVNSIIEREEKEQLNNTIYKSNKEIKVDIQKVSNEVINEIIEAIAKTSSIYTK
ncbi:hypothetical protein [Clostridium butyricum]|uniref:hypothetical protein n=1 Tax=Clostridium butyricum TaxID=1492 RepID=UPI00325A5F00